MANFTEDDKVRILNAFKKQKTLADRLYFLSRLKAYSTTLTNNMFTDEESQMVENPNTDEATRANLIQQEAMRRQQYNFPPADPASSDLFEDFIADLQFDVVEEIIGDGSLEDAKKAVFDLIIVNSKVTMIYDDVIQKKYAELKAQNPNDDMLMEKAMFLAYKSKPIEDFTCSAFSEFKTSMNFLNVRDGKEIYVPEEAVNYFSAYSSEIRDRVDEETERKYAIGSRMQTIDIHLNRKPGETKEEFDAREAIFDAWKNGEGLDLALQERNKNLVDSYNELKNEFASENLMYDVVSDSVFLKHMTPDVSMSFIHGLILDLESTKSGKGIFHKNNTPEYTALLEELKNYEKVCLSGENLKAAEAKRKLIKAAKVYVTGKEKVRRDDWGRKRFTDTMVLLSELIDDDEFAEIAEKINTVREAKPTDENYFDVGLLAEDYRRITEVGYADEKIAQAKSNENCLDIPAAFVGPLRSVEVIFGKKFEDVGGRFEGVFKGRIVGAQKTGYLKFKEIKDDLPCIGPSNPADNAKLSDKDFAAIAYSATLTPEVAMLDARNQGKSADNILITGADYTTKLVEPRIPVECGDYVDVIQGGREAAVNAMKEYGKNNKEPLAHIIASAIRNFNDSAKISESMNRGILINGEICSRFIKMMERDRGLTIKVREEKIALEDIKKARGLIAAASIEAKATEAYGKLNDTKAELTTEQKKEYAADVLMKVAVDLSFKSCAKKCEGNPEYKADPSITNKVKCTPDNKFVECIADKKEMDSLRETVRKAVDSAKFSTFSIKEISNYLDTGKLAKDIANTINNKQAQATKQAAAAKNAAAKNAAPKAANKAPAMGK
ncbi:MAG: hypothetical protein K6F77_05920 [Lachnospiraceae bacterium]|nr:hypothetical protein [Lachnospiraceae bacterium]